MCMRYMIAIDGGGTKTLTVLFQEDGQILFCRSDPGTNPLDIGVEESRKRLLRAIGSAAGHAPGKLSAIYAGVAGLVYFEDFFPQDVRGMFGAGDFTIETDGRNLISSELVRGEDGCCLIVGTGCGTWIRRKRERDIFHVGGWGYLVDTLGSGYSLGREALRAVCLAHDGRGPATVLTELLEAETGGPLLSVLPALYAGGRARFASLAHLVFEGRRLGDRVCHDIVETGAARLSELIWAAAPHFDGGAFTVVAGGGIVTAYPDYLERIRLKCPEQAKLVLASAPPVFGGAVEAMHRSGLELPDGFRDTFTRDLRALTAVGDAGGEAVRQTNGGG